MHRRRAVLRAATVVAALGLSACSSGEPASEPAPAPATPVTTSQSAAVPQPAGLPAPEALTDVLYRLADPAIPGAQKLNLVQGATAGDAETLDKFAKALVDNGYTPPAFEATDIAWADSDPVDVVATITADKPDPGAGFSIPMEFTPYQGGWQLSKGTFDMLLTFRPLPAAPPR